MYHVPPTPALFSYIVNSTFGIFCGNLKCEVSKLEDTVILGNTPDAREDAAESGADDDDPHRPIFIDGKVAKLESSIILHAFAISTGRNARKATARHRRDVQST